MPIIVWWLKKFAFLPTILVGELRAVLEILKVVRDHKKFKKPWSSDIWTFRLATLALVEFTVARSPDFTGFSRF